MNRFFPKRTQLNHFNDSTLYQQIINPLNPCLSHNFQSMGQFLAETRNQAEKFHKNYKKIDRYPTDNKYLREGIIEDQYFQIFDWKQSMIGYCSAEKGILFNGIQNFYLKRNMYLYTCSFKFSESGESVYLGNSIGQLQHYDTNSLQLNRKIDLLPYPIISMQTLKNKNVIVGKSSGQVIIHDLRLYDTQIQQYNPPCQMACQSIAHNDTILGAGFGDGTIRLLDMRKPLKPFWEFSPKTTKAKGLSWCPWAPYILASGGRDGKIKIWNCSQQQLKYEIDCHSQISHLMWVPADRLLLSSHFNGQCYGWNSLTYELEERLIRHESKILSMKLNPSDQYELATIGDDLELKFWNIMIKEQKMPQVEEQSLQLR